MFARVLTARKKLLRPSNAAFVRKQLETKTVQRILTEGRVKGGWGTYLGDVRSFETERTIVEGEGDEKTTTNVPEYVFDVDIIVFCVPKRGRRDDVLNEEFDKIREIVATNLNGKKFELLKDAKELAESQVDLSKAVVPEQKEKKPRKPREKKPANDATAETPVQAPETVAV